MRSSIEVNWLNTIPFAAGSLFSIRLISSLYTKPSDQLDEDIENDHQTQSSCTNNTWFAVRHMLVASFVNTVASSKSNHVLHSCVLQCYFTYFHTNCAQLPIFFTLSFSAPFFSNMTFSADSLWRTYKSINLGACLELIKINAAQNASTLVAQVFRILLLCFCTFSASKIYC